MSSGFNNIQLVQEFEKFTNFTLGQLQSCYRFALNKGGQIIKKETTKNLRSVLPAAFHRNPLYSDSMAQGIRVAIFKDKDNKEAKVHIMGTRSSKSGTYRLRFFEKGTKERKNKKTGKSYGRIEAMWFFRDAVNTKYGQAMNEIKSVLQETIKRISSKQ